MTVNIIAEAGVNHNGDKDLAFELVKVAAASGADAVKFQTFNAQRLAALTAPKARYQQSTTDAMESQLAMLKKLELPEAWHSELKAYATELGITFISTAFDIKSLAFLQTLDLPYYKVPSGEITNAPLLLAFAGTGKNLIISTGMATLGEVEQALAVVAYGYSHNSEPSGMDDVWRFWSSASARSAIAGRVSLLHCTSQYPTPMSEVNLRAMDTLRQAFALPVGYSDHSEGLLIPVAAVARGATIIEKHFTLDRQMPGPDHRASLEPDELAEMVSQIREIESALGDGQKRPQESEWDTRQAARQQIIFAEPVVRGDIITRSALTTARCGRGLSPALSWDLVGTAASQDFKPGDVPE
ncbi:N-acetylneuraminate synthase [Marinobacter confluentis]|uniref:N-acetylneuraminate synthase n=1 Tax=Marinobacter confluentis TaxID=1697557 RepID=A0A4Z1BZ08_9GAMM|nr:N-acetylneuraminate synthase [Marinobacter confluentis]TGN39928.1 N-acetylneuraminate synthase [Marinobacter confluentis]